jgi:FAD/FMN-containing dehydrogenase
VHSYDISFNIRKWGEFVEKARRDIDGYVIGYGHIGDGNLHLNICLERGKTFEEKDIFEEVVKNHGSISAEHGIGLHKP